MQKRERERDSDINLSDYFIPAAFIWIREPANIACPFQLHTHKFLEKYLLSFSAGIETVIVSRRFWISMQIRVNNLYVFYFFLFFVTNAKTVFRQVHFPSIHHYRNVSFYSRRWALFILFTTVICCSVRRKFNSSKLYRFQRFNTSLFRTLIRSHKFNAGRDSPQSLFLLFRRENVEIYISLKDRHPHFKHARAVIPHQCPFKPRSIFLQPGSFLLNDVINEYREAHRGNGKGRWFTVADGR